MKKTGFIVLSLLLTIWAVQLQDCWLLAQADEEEFRLPAYEKYSLSNGLTVYLMEQKEVPLISLSLSVQAGAVKDLEMSGLASITADALTFGTRNYSRESLEEELDFLGASLSSEASLEYARLTARFLAKDQAVLFNLIREVLTSPTFPEDELENQKNRRIVDLKRAKESPRSVIRDYYKKFVLQEHPLASPVSGTVPSVEQISRQHVVDFYQRNYTPSSACLAVVGDFSIAEMKHAVGEYFGDWNTKKPEEFIMKQPDIVTDRPRVLLINKDDARETQFLIGGPGIPRNHKDYVLVTVVNTILGGRFTSWLMDEVMVNAGLTYGARSSFITFTESGLFNISSFTRIPTTVEAIDLALHVLDSLHIHGLNEQTLNSAKNYVKGGFPPRFERSGDLVRLLNEMFIYDFDESYVNNYMMEVDAIDVNRANGIISKYFPRDNLQFVLIGKAAEIKELVSKYGKLFEKEINTEGF
jgi:predicted Zn-dependent peptidase